MTRVHLKLLFGLLAFFALVFLGMWVYEPLRVWYYARAYRSETDARERIRIVDILCESERGKKALYDAFRERCISEMVKIPAGSFMMGSEKGKKDVERPVHRVALSGFWMDKYEVTYEKYYVFVKLTGYGVPENYWETDGIHDDEELYPVLMVSWHDANAYADWLKMELPTEAQWEYACRAGSSTEYCYGDDPARLGEYAWYDHNTFNGCQPVGKKKPNNWGLYDMHGNAWEWCNEDFKFYSERSDFPNPSKEKALIMRGGCWLQNAKGCTSYRRMCDRPDANWFQISFRLVSNSAPR